MFISRTKPGGPAASRAGVERKPGRRRAEEGRPPGGRRPCPAWVAGLRELKGPLCSVPRLPAGQERISSAAPDPGGSAAPLGTDTNSSRPSCRPVALGTKLNRLTSPGRCVATGIDSPSGPPRPRPGAEVAVAMETAGRGWEVDAPARPRCPRRLGAAARIQGCSCPRRKRITPSGGDGVAWPRAGQRRPRCGPRAPHSQPGFLSQREALVLCHPSNYPVFSCSLVSHQAATWAPALLTRSRWQQGRLPSPPFRWPRKSLPRLATCLGGGDCALLTPLCSHPAFPPPWFPPRLLCLPLESVL